MPCTYYTPGEERHLAQSELANARKTADRLQKNLCEIWNLLYRDGYVTTITNTRPSAKTLNILDHHRELWERHRYADQEHEVARITREINDLDSQIARIKNLGGVPSDLMMKKRATLDKKIEKVKKANPLTTKLF